MPQNDTMWMKKVVSMSICSDGHGDFFTSEEQLWIIRYVSTKFTSSKTKSSREEFGGSR
jgi:hypothetical protein